MRIESTSLKRTLNLVDAVSLVTVYEIGYIIGYSSCYFIYLSPPFGHPSLEREGKFRFIGIG
ncbi:MAG: hypothetical protein ACI9YU_001598 [Flavobacteriales bacterium]